MQKRIKLTALQVKTIKVLQEYPNAIIMTNMYLTGGHGVKLDLRTVRSLQNKGLIEYNKLSQKGIDIKPI